MWDVFLQTQEAANYPPNEVIEVAGYMGTRETRATLHGVSLYIFEDNVGFFFSKFWEVVDVSTVKSKNCYR